MELLPALPDAAVPVKQLVRREKGVSYYNVRYLQFYTTTWRWADFIGIERADQPFPLNFKINRMKISSAVIQLSGWPCTWLIVRCSWWARDWMKLISAGKRSIPVYCCELQSINGETNRFYTEHINFCRFLLIYWKGFCIISLVDFS